MSRQRKRYDDDDGRVIANMNVDGMPWFLSDALKRRSGSEAKNDFSDLTQEESRELVKGAVKAGLLIAGVFVLGALLFILFCIHIWF